ncbi:hypothetical protein Q5Y75_15085 [Ruegeria sp. 2205SS24-7]|uniref:hypothetical protein n=1 Tax=Ruegeria discodermiae TaxID=3064389 RepID=UPI0027417831|nr:hypothetical protein [Ruegeria sp. 2205SS24-7]MDP5218551.1 hypothetical protein [Ruegeria sp. 2205SS24-7]
MPVDTDIGDIQAPSDDLVLEPGQDLVLLDDSGNELMRLDANLGIIRLRRSDLSNIVQIQGGTGNILLGGAGSDGDIFLFDASNTSQNLGDATIHLNADGRSVRVGQSDNPGTIRVVGNNEGVQIDGSSGAVIASGRTEVRTDSGQLRAQLRDNGNATIGGSGARGRLELRNDSSDGTVVFNGEVGHGRMGGHGTDSRLEMRRADGTVTIVLNGETGNVGLGAPGGGEAGALFVKDGSGTDTFTLNGSTGEARFGGSGNSGLLALRDDGGQETVVLNGATGNVGLGRFGTSGDLFVKNDNGNNTIHLSGNTGNMNLSGDVRFTNNVADCAEEFDLGDQARENGPGTVMVIGEGGKLHPSTSEYDTAVAGVVSGAGGLRPGVILGQDADAKEGSRCHLAVLGRVFVKADSALGSINVGDLLTTSPIEGHAMRVSDRARATGAVIGKSLGTLSEGRGMVQILICLQ